MSGCTHLVPTLPPLFDGVGDFALRLAIELERRAGVEARYVVGQPSWSHGDRRLNHAEAVPRRDAVDLCAALERGPDRVLLHYVGYGYTARGCPSWLVNGIERWLRGNGARRLVTVFHEVFATGKPWQSSFWLSPLQRRLASRLARASWRLVTSLERYRALLSRWVPAERIQVLPVFSTVGEPAVLSPLSSREARVVVFGSAGNRRRAYTAGAEALAAVCGATEATEIADVGHPIAGPAAIAGVPVHALGVLSDAEVSEVLQRARAGFLCYPVAFLPKSTAFAAYCAHGVAPVCSDLGGNDFPELLPPLTDPEPAASLSSLEAAAQAAHQWYQHHRLEHHIAIYRQALA